MSQNGMVKLYTSDGRFVAEVLVPPWKTSPELYVWGERFFLLREDGRYTEAKGSYWIHPGAAHEPPPPIKFPEREPVEPARGEDWKGKPKSTTDGEPPEDGSWDGPAPKPIDPETGQHGAYYVLPEEERKKGFVRPLRTAYLHKVCGALTTMSRSIAETYARDPSYYGQTFCVKCKTHLPVREFVWDGTGPKVRTDQNDWTGFEGVGS